MSGSRTSEPTTPTEGGRTLGRESTSAAQRPELSDSPAETVADQAARARSVRASRISFFARHGIAIIFLLLVAVFMVTNSDFRNLDNLRNVLLQSSIIGIVACGMLVMIITGGFDLSVGAIGAGSSVAAAAVMIHQSVIMGALAALAVGLAVGTVNGFVITKVGITPFVATLGMSVLVTGLVFAPTNAQPIAGIPIGFTNLGLGRWLGLPIPFICFAFILVVTRCILKYTRVGHYVFAVGSNREASKLAGVPVDRIVMLAFMYGGLMAGFGGLILLAQTGIGQPSGASDWPLTAIAAVVVGGTPLRGGIGGIGSVIVGTLLLGVLSNALNLYGVSPYWQPAVTGLVILLAVGVDSYQRKTRGDTA